VNRLSLSLLGCVCVLIAAACAAGVSTPAPDTVTAQIARGQPVYAQNCATAKCHGAQGQGLGSGHSFQAWPLVGAEFQARNPNAQVVFDVVRSGSEQNLRALTDQQIYDAIAYEWLQNGAQLAAPLGAQTAANVASRSATIQASSAALFPPPGDASPEGSYAGGVVSSSDNYLAWRVDQVVLASMIGGQAPANGGAFLIAAMAFSTETRQPLVVGPEFLRLSDSRGDSLEPQAVDLAYPIERFQTQTILPEHGTAAVAIFALPAGAAPAELTYDDHTGHPLRLKF
jgi:mono/diheme cytochrome c family protein